MSTAQDQVVLVYLLNHTVRITLPGHIEAGVIDIQITPLREGLDMPGDIQCDIRYELIPQYANPNKWVLEAISSVILHLHESNVAFYPAFKNEFGNDPYEDWVDEEFDG